MHYFIHLLIHTLFFFLPTYYFSSSTGHTPLLGSPSDKKPSQTGGPDSCWDMFSVSYYYQVNSFILA